MAKDHRASPMVPRSYLSANPLRRDPDMKCHLVAAALQADIKMLVLHLYNLELKSKIDFTGFGSKPFSSSNYNLCLLVSTVVLLLR